MVNVQNIGGRHLCKTGAWIVLLVFICQAAFAQFLPDTADDTWTTNGPVYALKALEQTMYVGGYFDYMGPETGNFVPIDKAGVLASNTFPNVLGTVHACVSDDNGGWYIGGDFTYVHKKKRLHVAHLIPSEDGLTLDEGFNPVFNDTVYALA